MLTEAFKIPIVLRSSISPGLASRKECTHSTVLGPHADYPELAYKGWHGNICAIIADVRSHDGGGQNPCLEFLRDQWFRRAYLMPTSDVGIGAPYPNGFGVVARFCKMRRWTFRQLALSWKLSNLTAGSRNVGNIMGNADSITAFKT